MTPRSPGRPRDPAVDERVLGATLELLTARGFDGLRVDHVAQTSGVPKSTIYRRWPSLRLLAVDAVERAIEPQRFVASDDVVADLGHLVEIAHETLIATPLAKIVPQLGMDLADHPELLLEYRRRTTEPLRGAAIETVERGNRAGLWSVAEPDQFVNFFIGGLIYRSTYLGEHPTLADARRMADLLVGRPVLSAPSDAAQR